MEAERPSAPAWPLRTAAVVLAVLGLLPVANIATEGFVLRWWGPAVRQWIAWSAVLACVALLLARLLPRTISELTARGERLLLRATPRWFSVFAALLVALLAAFFGWYLYRWQPVTIDELSQRWQASLMTAGRLTARAEPHGEFFSTMQTVEWNGRWFSHFTVGGPALLALGALVGVPYLVNPLLIGIAAVAVYRFARATSGEVEARVATLLFALSPFVLFIAASELDHVAALAATWIAVAALPAWSAARTEREAHVSAAWAGAALGVTAAIRPYDALLAALAVGAFQLVVALRATHRATLLRSLVTQAVVGAVPVAFLLLYNRATTGDPLLFAYDVLNGPEHRPGFHMSPLGFPHTPRHGVYTISSYLMRLNIVLLGWPVPALLVVVIGLVATRRATRWDVLLMSLLGVVLAGYFAYWGEGSFQGPRFLFALAPVFLIYTARAFVVLHERAHATTARAAVTIFAPLCLAVAWLAPPTPASAFGIATLSERAKQWDSVTTLIVDATERAGLRHALVFVPESWHERLTARLRALGSRPFAAQVIVGHYDACSIQKLLDDADRVPPAQRTAFVFAALDTMPIARPVPGLTALEQLALTPGRAPTPECRAELQTARATGGDLARLLPLEEVDSAGRLSGAVVYARDFGPRNELLRDRFGDRDWYVARVLDRDGTTAVELEKR